MLLPGYFPTDSCLPRTPCPAACPCPNSQSAARRSAARYEGGARRTSVRPTHASVRGSRATQDASATFGCLYSGGYRCNCSKSAACNASVAADVRANGRHEVLTTSPVRLLCLQLTTSRALHGRNLSCSLHDAAHAPCGSLKCSVRLRLVQYEGHHFCAHRARRVQRAAARAHHRRTI